MTITKLQKNEITQNVIFCILMAFTFFLSLWKCFYGFQECDEPFYFTIANRLIQGDTFFKDEWHLSQLSAVLRVPFIFLYKLFHGSTEGILLAMRITYLCLRTVMGTWIYFRLRKYRYAAVIAVTLYYLFELYPLCTFSYNATAMDSLLVAGIFLATEEQKRKLPLMITGIFLSFSVLSCPYVAIIYIFYVLTVLFRIFWHKLFGEKGKNTVIFTYLFEVNTFLWITVGIVLCAFAFLLFVFSRTDIENIVRNFPSVLFGDPEHIQSSFIKKIIDYFLAILFCCGYIYFCFFAYFITVVAMLLDKKRKCHRSIYFSVSTVIAIVSFLLMYSHLIEMYFTAVMFPVMFVGFTAYLLCEHQPKPLFYCVFIPGIIYSFCVHFSSNQLYTVIFMAMAVSNIACIIFIFVFLQELKSEKENQSSSFKKIHQKVCQFLFILELSMQILFLLAIKVYHLPYGNNMKNMTCQIEQGPAKGIFTSKNNLESYNCFYDRLSYYQNKTPDRIVITDIRTWGYLYLDQFPCGSYSSWASGIKESSYQRLKDYYALNPENKAKYIYLPEESVSVLGINDIYTESARYGYSVEKQDGIYYLEK